MFLYICIYLEHPVHYTVNTNRVTADLAYDTVWTIFYGLQTFYPHLVVNLNKFVLLDN